MADERSYAKLVIEAIQVPSASRVAGWTLLDSGRWTLDRVMNVTRGVDLCSGTTRGVSESPRATITMHIISEPRSLGCIGGQDLSEVILACAHRAPAFSVVTARSLRLDPSCLEVDVDPIIQTKDNYPFLLDGS